MTLQNKETALSEECKDGRIGIQIKEIHRSEKVRLSQSCVLDAAWMLHQN